MVECPLKIQSPEVGRGLHHSRSNPRSRHRHRRLGLGPRRYPRLKRVVALILDLRTQVRMTICGL